MNHTTIFFSNLKETRHDIPSYVMWDLIKLDGMEIDKFDEIDRRFLVKQFLKLKKEKIPNIQNYILDSLLPSLYNEIVFLYPMLFYNSYIPISYIYLALDNLYSRKFMNHVDTVLENEYKNGITVHFSKVLYYYIPILFKYRYSNIFNTILQNAMKNEETFNMKVYDILLRFNFKHETDKLLLHKIEQNITVDNKDYSEYILSNYSKFRYYHYKINTNKYLHFHLHVKPGFNNGFCYSKENHVKFVTVLSKISTYSHFITYYDEEHYVIFNYKEWYDYLNKNGFMTVFENQNLENYTFQRVMKVENVKYLLSNVNFMTSRLTMDEQKYSSLLSVLISDHIVKMNDKIHYYLYLLSLNFKNEYDMFCDSINVISELIINKIDSTNWILLSIQDSAHKNEEFKTNSLNHSEHIALLIEVLKLLKKSKIYMNVCDLLTYETISLNTYLYSGTVKDLISNTKIINILSYFLTLLKNKSKNIVI